MTRAEQQELARDVTLYRIQKDFGDKSNTYRIDKLVACVEMDTYHIQINPIRENGIGTLWCDCQGFRRQKFAFDKHKHILIGFDYIERDTPEWAEYTIKGTGVNAKIRFIRSAE